MEQVNGGKNDLGCGASLASVVLDAGLLILAGAMIGTGPIGAGAAAGLFGSLFGTALSGMTAFLSCL